MKTAKRIIGVVLLCVLSWFVGNSSVTIINWELYTQGIFNALLMVVGIAVSTTGFRTLAATLRRGVENQQVSFDNHRRILELLESAEQEAFVNRGLCMKIDGRLQEVSSEAGATESRKIQDAIAAIPKMVAEKIVHKTKVL